MGKTNREVLVGWNSRTTLLEYEVRIESGIYCFSGTFQLPKPVEFTYIIIKDKVEVFRPETVDPILQEFIIGIVSEDYEKFSEGDVQI